jgi:hypothetical protein
LGAHSTTWVTRRRFNERMSAREGKRGDRGIHVVVRAGAGEWRDCRFSAQARPRRVIESAVRRFGLVRDPRAYAVRVEATGRPLRPGQRLLDAGLRDGDVLVVEDLTPGG